MKILIGVIGALAGLLVLGAVATLLITRSIEARYPPTGSFVAVEGGRLHYVEAGRQAGNSQPAIVFLHGASSSHADAMLVLGERLAERYRVIAIDRPGQGWSERIAGADAAAPSRQAAIIREALRKLNVERAVVVGHSLAGAILPNLALDHADVVAATLYLAPVTHPWPNGTIAWYYRPAASSLLGWLMTRTLTTPLGLLLLETAVDEIFAPRPAPPGYADKARIALALRPPVFQANAQDVAGLYAAVSAQQARYREIRVPTVVIAGDADTIVSTGIHARGLVRDIPGTKLIVLPQVGHMPHHAAPDVVIAEIDVLARAVSGE
jgi:pimeloyl-ACP methyl ester carboxylesterase